MSRAGAGVRRAASTARAQLAALCPPHVETSLYDDKDLDYRPVVRCRRCYRPVALGTLSELREHPEALATALARSEQRWPAL